jgi:hypothetical protein
MLEPICILGGLLVDDNHQYIKKILICTPGSFSFLLTAGRKDLIERPRENNQSLNVSPVP